MTEWNYRVIKKEYPLPKSMGDGYEYVYEIREVYYDEDGKIQSWTEEPVGPTGNDEKDLLGSMILMMNAFREPVLEIDRNDEIVRK